MQGITGMRRGNKIMGWIGIIGWSGGWTWILGWSRIMRRRDALILRWRVIYASMLWNKLLTCLGLWGWCDVRGYGFFNLGRLRDGGIMNPRKLKVVLISRGWRWMKDLGRLGKFVFRWGFCLLF